MLHLSIEAEPDWQTVLKLKAALLRAYQTQFPILAAQKHEAINVAALDDERTLIGGVNGEAELGWLYVDSLWVAADQRQHGLGTRLMTAIEQTALRQGMNRVYLMTADFQALGFYQKLGYRVVGIHPERPRGHCVYYLIKTDLTPTAIDSSFWIYSPPRDDLVRSVERQQVNASPIPVDVARLGIFLRDASGGLHGGLYGHLFWDWLDIHTLWLDEALRGQPYAAQLIRAAELWTRAQGGSGICTDTLDTQLRDVYHQQGFVATFTLPDRPLGHSAYFLHKILS